MTRARLETGQGRGAVNPWERAKSRRTKTMPWRWLPCVKCGLQCNRHGYGRDGLAECPRGGRHESGE